MWLTTSRFLKSVVDADDKHEKQLISDDLYQKVSQNLPVNYIMFSYVDMGRSREVLKQNEAFMGQKGKELLAFEPFLKLYDSFGAVSRYGERQFGSAIICSA